jgi:adenylate kinase family enzyme
MDKKLTEKEQQDLIFSIMTSGEGKSALADAVTNAFLCTPYSTVTAMLTGRGSAVAPNEEELLSEMESSGLSRDDAYNKLVDENLLKFKD